MTQLGSVWEAGRITNKVEGQPRGSSRFCTVTMSPHNSQSQSVTAPESFNENFHCAILQRVSSESLSMMPWGVHIAEALHPGGQHLDELSAGFSVFPAGEESKRQGSGDCKLAEFCLLLRIPDTPEPPHTHTHHN